MRVALPARRTRGVFNERLGTRMRHFSHQSSYNQLVAAAGRMEKEHQEWGREHVGMAVPAEGDKRFILMMITLT